MPAHVPRDARLPGHCLASAGRAAAKPWHYWVAPILGLSFVGLMLMMVVGYVVKVVMLKYGVKVGRKST